MQLLENIQKETIIICEQSYKKALLQELNKKHLFLHLKFFTKIEFIQEYFFSYNEEAISYLISKYHFKIDVAKMYLENLYYIEDNANYDHPKLEFLQKIKNELKGNNLLIYNPLFSSYLQNKQIIVYGYPYLENYLKNALDKLNAIYYKENEVSNDKNVLEFFTLKDECFYVAKKIAELLTNGINIENIKLVNVNEDYYNELKFTFDLFNIPIKIPSSNNLMSNPLTKEFLNNFPHIDTLPEDNPLTEKIINILNKYTFVSDENILKELVIHELKQTKIDNYKWKRYVEIKNIYDYLNPDDYIFLMNFNAGFIPETLKDEEYITDNLRPILNMDSTINQNKQIKAYTIHKLNTLNNLVISYKLKDNKKEYYPSPLINELNLNVQKITDDYLVSYSKEYDQIRLATLEDDYRLYNSTSPMYFALKNNLDIPYNTYDNTFKGINPLDLQEYLKNNLTLSYSSLNNYNKCAFKYYMANILKLDKYEETFEAFIGSLFHYVLSQKNISDLDKTVKDYILKEGKELSIKERFYLRKLMPDLKFVLDEVNKQVDAMCLKKDLREKNITINKNVNNFNVKFTGFIDKILYEEDSENTYIAIIDYKTGNVSINLNYLLYGLNMQLPIYLYLVKKSNLFNNPRFVGFYLEFILNKDIKRGSKSYLEERCNSLKLQGYSNDSFSVIKRFDASFENSNLISGLKVTKEGSFYSSANVLNDMQIESIINLTEKNIDDNINKIIKGEFPINPKRIAYKDDVSCEFCKFRDLCFKSEKDYVNLEDINSLNFLGGDDNA